MARLDYILKLMASQDADGLYLKAGSAPEVFVGKRSRALALPAFTEKQLRDFVREITTPEDLATLHMDGNASIHYEYDGGIYICDLRAGGEEGLSAMFRVHDRDVDRLAVEDEEVDLFEDIDASVDEDIDFDLDEPDLLGPDPVPVSPPRFVPEPLPEEPDDPEELAAPSMRIERPGRRPQAAPPVPASGSGPEAAETQSLPAVSPGGGLRPAVTIHYTRKEVTTPPGYGDQLSRDALHKLLRWMIEQEATDLHITPKFPPTLRVDNLFQPSQGRQLTPKEIERVILSILSEAQRADFRRDNSVDLAYQVEGLGRFRINVFRQLYGVSAAIRYIPAKIESLESLKLPPELAMLGNEREGLVLFTGPTGSGKSTSMAAIIEQMNSTRQLHILTLEAPIEYIFENRMSLIQQREVGNHTASFSRGLRDALRENPDVIMVGELRDYETVQMAVSAAETGHLIIATMHANSTNNAISRLIDVFPDNQKAGARAMIADVMRAVVNLRLLTHASGRGLVPAVELLKCNHAVASMIREDKFHQLRQALMTGTDQGMWPFERYLADLYRRKEIMYQDAYASSPDKKVFEQLVERFRKKRPT
jgi:twitching motility protein PilT